MAKFDNGDRFEVKTNGLKGTIKYVIRDYTDYGMVEEYEVKWDSFSQSFRNSYMADDVDDLWDKIADIKNDTYSQLYADDAKSNLPYGIYGVMPGDNVKKDCEHKWVEVGFQFTKMVCYHCDKEKPQ